ncbi:uncharacterized protein LOC122398860 [Colletes gigas]|uniref:uncharacterized protein LOC122398860 n=1 Tax=Colletes gigas TaxID=935657 RepID=UPI001C9A9072|nr:uncharacterized protein LOC122398860 [Colletes gigas]XP_043255038.1 uncharacterized protein LOC122398860 [Colletes gigas]XP_043255039.1 uncharacterized protein LOC122398860 [Colletes gigas]XP_043255040.1 uncharacterized protein LOC122398860 [Colletes gigas]
MKWIIFGTTLIIWIYIIMCQDIVFPDDEETSHISGNNAVITERIPVSIPGQCPQNMLLYPGDGNKSTWICDCRPRFLYFPLNDTCHEAYMQGPCAPQDYVVLPKNEAVPKCIKNPCNVNGLVPYNGTCYSLRTIGGPCAPNGVLGVNETTFELECIPIDIAPFIIIQPPKRQCPLGSRRNSLGICREVI